MDYNTITFIFGLLINVVRTAMYYFAPILIYRFLIYKKRLPRKRAAMVCIISGNVMYLILVAMYITTITEGIPNMNAAFLYTTIAYFLVREKKVVRGE